ncbi:MAG: hypothetical protein BWK72_09715 [Rhodoferax ferrireducens]|uniref:Uncharacterized protein n=1 Tax=Rhodoferax ferrireducens TaxID=192843 RepID=A0A1W9KU32_9BURK|nr:MAG: hypothetical protein BWK72_09715 [Rhodoferax ferrireducens]
MAATAMRPSVATTTSSSVAAAISGGQQRRADAQRNKHNDGFKVATVHAGSPGEQQIGHYGRYPRALRWP